ncbi:hypothetical protein DFH94DRAFT_16470 [Russula ochroleuca]|uniref:Secreted protein n=1 Tax=Russula ochroleuca TaxID=152965 RepID=A0A9P5N6F9_9AGAM|nr:hypothetical protein DFH94DRAFT_16470 [Russula ochroleuca]
MPSCAFSFLLCKRAVQLCSATGCERHRHVPEFLTSGNTALLEAACVATCRGSGCKRKLAKRNPRVHVCELRGWLSGSRPLEVR